MNMHPNGLGLERASVVEIVQGTDEVLLGSLYARISSALSWSKLLRSYKVIARSGRRRVTPLTF